MKLAPIRHTQVFVPVFASDAGGAGIGGRSAPCDVANEQPTGVDQPRPGRFSRASAWTKATATRLGDRATSARESHASVDVGFRTAERQRRVAAMVLAGGIAYRIFFWLLAVSVVVSGVLGFFDPDAVQSTLEHHGMAGWQAAAVASLTRSVGRERVVAAPRRELPGALDGLHLQQGARARPRDHLGSRPAEARKAAPRLAALQRLHARLHRRDGGRPVCPGAEPDRRVRSRRCSCSASPSASGCSPRTPCRTRATGWLELVPGAIVVAVGLQAMHVFTVYFLGPKLESATQLYGVVGIVTTLLFWFYLGGRLIVAGATLDVEFTELRAANRRERGGGGMSVESTSAELEARAARVDVRCAALAPRPRPHVVAPARVRAPGRRFPLAARRDGHDRRPARRGHDRRDGFDADRGLARAAPGSAHRRRGDRAALAGRARPSSCCSSCSAASRRRAPRSRRTRARRPTSSRAGRESLGVDESAASSANSSASSAAPDAISTLVAGAIDGIEGVASILFGLSLAALSLFLLLKDGPSMRRCVDGHLGRAEAGRDDDHRQRDPLAARLLPRRDDHRHVQRDRRRDRRP